ncbi:MAG: hypothetical protein U1E22_03670, partial [Coriobacteriia bacterium]|nr:hypothetical protein [Coriobacteriia bacterium]
MRHSVGERRVSVRHKLRDKLSAQAPKRLKNSPRRHGGTEPEEKVGCWSGSVFAALATPPALKVRAKLGRVLAVMIPIARDFAADPAVFANSVILPNQPPILCVSVVQISQAVPCFKLIGALGGGAPITSNTRAFPRWNLALRLRGRRCRHR